MWNENSSASKLELKIMSRTSWIGMVPALLGRSYRRRVIEALKALLKNGIEICTVLSTVFWLQYLKREGGISQDKI